MANETNYDELGTNATVAGSPARIISVSSDNRTFYARFSNGNMARVVSRRRTTLSEGDTILIADNGWTRVPADTWPESTRVGVVREVYETELLIEFSSGLEVTSHTGETEVSVGNTILHSRDAGVLRILSPAPLRPDFLGRDAEASLNDFRVPATPSAPTFADFGGNSYVVERARELIETQFMHRGELLTIGARPVKGVILTGPPGTGKTLLAQIIASEIDAAFYLISGPSIVSKFVGDSEELLRRIFKAAESEQRAIIFFDEIDSIAEQRGDNSHEASKRLVAQLLTLMDGFDRSKGNVVIVAATNRIEHVDAALLRPGRFDWAIEIGSPGSEDRLAILQASSRRLTVDGSLPLEEIAAHTDGWSAAKLTSIWTEAALLAAGDGRSAITEEDTAEAFERISTRTIIAHDGTVA